MKNYVKIFSVLSAIKFLLLLVITLFSTNILCMEGSSTGKQASPVITILGPTKNKARFKLTVDDQIFEVDEDIISFSKTLRDIVEDIKKPEEASEEDKEAIPILDTSPETLELYLRLIQQNSMNLYMPGFGAFQLQESTSNVLKSLDVPKLCQLADLAFYLDVQLPLVEKCLEILKNRVMETANNNPNDLGNLMQNIKFKSDILFHDFLQTIPSCKDLIIALMPMPKIENFSAFTFGTPIVISPDGTKVAGVALALEDLFSSASIIYILDSSTGQEIATFSSQDVTEIAWSSDNTKIAYTDKKTIYICDVATRQCLSSIPLSPITHTIKNIQWSPDNTKIAAFLDNNLSIWNVAMKQLELQMPIDFIPITAQYHWSPNSQMIIQFYVTTSDSKIFLVDIAQKTIMKTFDKPHGFFTSSSPWNKDSTMIAFTNLPRNTGRLSEDLAIKLVLYNTAQAKEDIITNNNFQRYGQIPPLAWSPVSDKLAIMGNQHATYILAMPTGNILKVLRPTSTHMPLVWSPDETKIITDNPTGGLTIWDSTTGSAITKLKIPSSLPKERIRSLQWDKDQTQIIANTDQLVLRWKVKDSTLEQQACDDLPFVQLAPLLAYSSILKINHAFNWQDYPQLLSIAYMLPASIKDFLNLPAQPAEQTEPGFGEKRKRQKAEEVEGQQEEIQTEEEEPKSKRPKTT